MRPLKIVVVSALFPPNFIGGATVQAQRLARGFHSRGHQVRVFAGARDETRRPLERWDEIDEIGMSVSWLATTPWFEFDDDRNHHNPDAESAFSEFLASEPADVVHFHALQGLGAGLLGVAKNAGARVVVTMHDWWWYCARQFLADRRLIPCCPVVDAGVCPCQSDRVWLDRRRAYLDQMIVHADQVLAPSETAARSLEANGVDPARLFVDYNGLISDKAPSPGATDKQPGVTFMYAGGPFELKGIHLLLEAVGQIQAERPWRLHAYGAAAYADAKGILAPAHVALLEPFDPDRADEVFSQADVMLVPSVMRESHSLVTREALARGIPVICSDSWGPEEAVEHEVNGLVVPSADASALAHAMQRVVDNPELLARITKGSGAAASRTLDDQIDGLLERYRTIIDSPVALTPPRVRRVLFIVGIEGAPLRYRAWLPLEGLRLLGVDGEVVHYRDPSAETLARDCDVIVVYRVPATTFSMRILEDARRRGTPLVFDVDDLIFDPSLADDIPALKILAPADAALWLEGVKRYRITMEACDLFVGSTELLCRHAEQTTGLPAERFDNGVGLRMSRLSDKALRQSREDGPLRLAYFSGTDTHDRDWASIEGAVLAAMERSPDSELWLVGHLRPTDAVRALGPRVRRFGFQHWERLPSLLRQVDVNLAPLEPGTVFNEAKSAIKWLEAALVATPTVASPTGPFREAITHGQDGMLAASEEEWITSITSLLLDADERARVGNRARRSALFRWSPWIQARRYAEILERAVERPERRSPASIGLPTTLIHDEPVEPHPLEPYGLLLLAERAEASMPTSALDPSAPLRFSLDRSGSEIARVDLLMSVISGHRNVTVRLWSGEAVVAKGSAAVSSHPGKAWIAFDLDRLAAGSQIEVDIGAGEGETVLWTAASGRHSVLGSERPGDICFRAWGRSVNSEWQPPDDPPRPSVLEWTRAKLRYGRYMLRTRGSRGLVVWVTVAMRNRFRSLFATGKRRRP